VPLDAKEDLCIPRPLHTKTFAYHKKIKKIRIVNFPISNGTIYKSF